MITPDLRVCVFTLSLCVAPSSLVFAQSNSNRPTQEQQARVQERLRTVQASRVDGRKVRTRIGQWALHGRQIENQGAQRAVACAQVAHPPPSSPAAVLAAKCKAASFARRPAGTMATTMRDFEIKRCIKNGFLD